MCTDSALRTRTIGYRAPLSEAGRYRPIASRSPNQKDVLTLLASLKRRSTVSPGVGTGEREGYLEREVYLMFHHSLLACVTSR